MPRTTLHTKSQLIESAMMRFWQHGYDATSMDQLVQATGVSRHGLYGSFRSKEKIFVACLEFYSHEIVTPAFAKVEHPGATWKTVADYFEFVIGRAEKFGWPPPGCLMANTMTELAPHNATAFERVAEHNARLHSGFRNALGDSIRLENLSARKLDDRAAVLVTFTNGLWSMSRTASNAAELRRVVREFLQLFERNHAQ
jgi:TetR/AcrR family transcriptional regulator, transcriptional repressor for nem operon